MTDPLANVERLLDDMVECASDFDMAHKRPEEAREAVRLLLQEARDLRVWVERWNPALPLRLESATAATDAFAASLAGDPQ